ncbi:hypothetical protein HOY80DRAFT_1134945 [Tuber brumale]|nr:hypothetical protein HOY80DRAFT_1134945 [Tuber brumale]
MDNIVPTISVPQVVQSLKLVVCNEQSKSMKQKRLVDQLHAPLVNAPDSWLPTRRKATLLSTAVPTPSTELEVTGSGIRIAFNVASGSPIKGVEEPKTNHL